MKLSELEGDPNLIQLKDHWSIRYFVHAHRYIAQAAEDYSLDDYAIDNGLSDSDVDYITAAQDLLEAEGDLE